MKRQDERNGDTLEGQILSSVLKLTEKEVDYIYTRTRDELRFAMKELDLSGKRYLHLSCHGNKTSLALTLDTLSFASFSDDVSSHLKNRRIFISACEAVNDSLANALFTQNPGCYSLIGPRQVINFDKAALVWASFYHLTFEIDRDAMKHSDIGSVMDKVCKTFGVKFNYYRRIKKSPGFSKFSY